MLVLGPAEHGVHGVPHFMEQVVKGGGREKGWRPPPWGSQIQHQNNHRILGYNYVLSS